MAQDFEADINKGCIIGATDSIKKAGKEIDAKSQEIIESYCSCTANRAAKDLTLPELFGMAKNPPDEAASAKMVPIMRECMAQAVE